MPALYEDGFYGDFNMDEIDLGIENYEQLFGVALGNERFDGLFGPNELSTSDCQGAYPAEVYFLVPFIAYHLPYSFWGNFTPHVHRCSAGIVYIESCQVNF